MELRNKVIAYVKAHKKEEPSIGFLLKRFRRDGLNRVSFYDLFPNKKAELYYLAGITEKIDNCVGTALVESRKEMIHKVTKSHKELFKESSRKFEEELSERSYEALLKPEVTWKFASKVMPLLYPVLWDKVLEMSNNNPGEAFQEAIDLSGGPYNNIVKANIAQGKNPGDSHQKHISWIRGILEEWHRLKIRHKGGRFLPPGRINSVCEDCQNSLYVEIGTDKSVVCRKCNVTYTWTCLICDNNEMLVDNVIQLSCQVCGFRNLFNKPILIPTRYELEHERQLQYWREELGGERGTIILRHDGQVFARQFNLNDRRKVA